MSGDERTARSLAASSGRTVRNADQVQFRTRRNLRKTIEGQITHSKSESPVAISACAISAFQSYCLVRARSFTSHQQHTPAVLRLTNRNFRVCRAAPDSNKHGNHIQLASQIHSQKSRNRLRLGPHSNCRTKSTPRLGAAKKKTPPERLRAGSRTRSSLGGKEGQSAPLRKTSGAPEVPKRVQRDASPSLVSS
jgi:hypothetical protein